MSSFAVENSGEPVPGGVIAEGRDEGRCSAAPCRNGLVRAPYPPGILVVPHSQERLGREWMTRRRDDEVRGCKRAPDDAMSNSRPGGVTVRPVW